MDIDEWLAAFITAGSSSNHKGLLSENFDTGWIRAVDIKPIAVDSFSVLYLPHVQQMCSP